MLGFGCGLIVLAAVVFFYGYARSDNAGAAAVTETVMSDGEIIARARDLGMVSYMDFVRENGAVTDADENVDAKKETDDYPDENIDANAAGPDVETIPAEPEIVYIEVRAEPSDIEIIVRARALGMAFADETGGDENMPETAGQTIEADATAPADTPVIAGPVLSETYTGDMITVFVPSGSNANTIAGILYNNNIIENQTDFVNFIVGRGMAARLMSGPFSFYSGMPYDDILYILRGYRR